jgi:hypothetical protein
MEKIVDKLLQAKIVQPSKSAFNSPALLIREANFDKNKVDEISQYRLCVDYRSVNRLVCPKYMLLTSLDAACQSLANAGNVRFFLIFRFNLRILSNSTGRKMPRIHGIFHSF